MAEPPQRDLPYTLDYVAYLDAVSAAAREMGCSTARMCAHLGISHSAVSELRRDSRRRHNMRAAALINIMAWSGVDIKPFIVDNDRAGTRPSTLADIHPMNYAQALRVIEALREKLPKR